MSMSMLFQYCSKILTSHNIVIISRNHTMNNPLTALRFSSLNCALPRPNYGAVSIQKTMKKNGLKIAGAKLLGAHFGACTVMFKAGSRYESDDTLGATHFLRAGSNGKGKDFTAFTKMKCLQHHGGYLTCTSDRQTICYTLRCPPPLFKSMRQYLLDATKVCNFRWDIDDRRPVVVQDLTRMTPVEKVIDLIQKASFAGPLANSIYCDEYKINDVSEKCMNKFKDDYFGPDECTVASVGFPFEETILLADGIENRTGRKRAPEVCAIPRCGFEHMCLGPIGTTWMAFAIPGCGSRSIRYSVINAIIASACGTGSTQAGQHELDQMMERPLANLRTDLFTSFRAFNISYVDTGIFGILIQCPATKAREAAYQALQFLSSGLNQLSGEEIKAGIQRLKLNIMIHQQDCVNMAEGLALELASTSGIDENFDLICLLDSITPEEVSSVAQKLALQAPCFAFSAVGDLSYAPDDDDLRYWN